MKASLLERRSKLIQMRSSGVSLSGAVNDLAQRFEVTPRAIYKDWQNRKAWLKTILELKDPETVFLDLLSRHNEIYKKAVLEHLKADNSNARVGALNLMRKVNKDFVDMLVLRGVTDGLAAIKEKLNIT